MLKRIILKTILFLLSASALFTFAKTPNYHRVGLGYANNYYGYTYGVTYTYSFSPKWSVGIGFSRGKFDYIHKANTSMFGRYYYGDNDLDITIYINHFIDFIVCQKRKTQGRIRLFKKYGYGLSFYNITFEEIMVDSVTGWKYRGEKDYVNTALYLSADILGIRLSKQLPLNVVLGANVYTTILDAPQEITLYYDDYIPWNISMDASAGFNLIVYPQIFLKMEISF
ncbi:hypothetical protein KAX97_11305 [candidate division WOR-3 bacterium]|nr:hypothetical protein [candidate division WOR-3 bacterium]